MVVVLYDVFFVIYFLFGSIIPLFMGSEVAEVNLVHHQDLNKKILVALVVSSSLLGVLLLLLSCFWIFRLRKKANAKRHQKSGLLSLELKSH